MLQHSRTRAALVRKMGGANNNHLFHLLVPYQKRAGRGSGKSNTANAVSSAAGRFAREGTPGRYSDRESAGVHAAPFRSHVEHVLRVNLEENLAMIGDTVGFLHSQGRRVFYDAEHYFDGHKANPEHALATLVAAAEAGADRTSSAAGAVSSASGRGAAPGAAASTGRPARGPATGQAQGAAVAHRPHRGGLGRRERASGGVDVRAFVSACAPDAITAGTVGPRVAASGAGRVPLGAVLEMVRRTAHNGPNQNTDRTSVRFGGRAIKLQVGRKSAAQDSKACRCATISSARSLAVEAAPMSRRL